MTAPQLDLAALKADLQAASRLDRSEAMNERLADWTDEYADALIEAAERLTVLDDPGTPEAILKGMFEYAESLGHPKFSSNHAFGFLIEYIEKQKAEAERLREALAEPTRIFEAMIQSVDWTEFSSPMMRLRIQEATAKARAALETKSMVPPGYISLLKSDGTPKTFDEILAEKAALEVKK